MLVVGATGGTGREVVRQALERGKQVTALIRNPGDRTGFPADVRVVIGDVLDAESLVVALDGQRAVISALGVRRGQPVGTVRSAGTASLIAAMGIAGARRLIAVSSVGVGSSREAQTLPARLLWPRLVGPQRIKEADRAEHAIADSTLEWTIVRAPRLMDDTPSGQLCLGDDLRLTLSAQLKRADLAKALLDSLDLDDSIGRRLTALTR